MDELDRRSESDGPAAGRRWTATRLRGRWVRPLLAVALVLDLVVLGANLFLLDGVDDTTRVDLDEALSDFRSATTTTLATDLAAAATPSEVTVPPSAPETTVAPSTTVPGPTATSPTSPSTEPTAPSGPTAFQLPAEGVYRYRTAGGESVSLLGARHDYPTETYAVVRHVGGCHWHVRAEVVAQHVDERLMCSEPGRLLQLEQARLVTFFGTTDGGLFTCSPPQVQHTVGDAEGASSVTDCTGDGATARLTRRTLGEGTMTIGGTTVPVIRLRIDGEMSGRVRGASLDLVTIEATTGLPLVWERSVDNLANAFGTTIRYQEQVTFTLVSLTPTT